MDLELKTISATGLTKPNPLSKLHPYVVVSISGATSPAQETPVNSDGYTHNPNWNHPLKFSIPNSRVNNLTLKFRIHHRSIMANDKLVGEVCVPSGRPNGVLTFSYQIKDMRREEPVTSFSASKPQNSSMFYPVPADVYPPCPNPRAMGGCNYNVYPPLAGIPATRQLS